MPLKISSKQELIFNQHLKPKFNWEKFLEKANQAIEDSSDKTLAKYLQAIIDFDFLSLTDKIDIPFKILNLDLSLQRIQDVVNILYRGFVLVDYAKQYLKNNKILNDKQYKKILRKNLANSKTQNNSNSYNIKKCLKELNSWNYFKIDLDNNTIYEYTPSELIGNMLEQMYFDLVEETYKQK
ncbi:hypothetical protein NPA08_04165 [Mycoplasmopsis citelli]|uniref:hypothetical protein n=1 Tax=Mycoplasmopsis citelli TaxID=171281 RepID=UPI00211424B3|nr:hypothetical protein [Mycoplasmopsis citelli]UUD36116.1 hypothetical protein NPA08_04165 [Mycoplasmopsis citelli]